MQRMPLIRIASLGLFFFLGITPNLSAQSMDVRGGNQTLGITTGFAGSEPIDVVNTNSSLRYRKTLWTTKITVATVCPSQNFTLKVLATSVTSGIAAPEVTLTNGMPSTDFITGIPAGLLNFVTATLHYTASATFTQGNSAEEGNDVHTVTYTLVAQ